MDSYYYSPPNTQAMLPRFDHCRRNRLHLFVSGTGPPQPASCILSCDLIQYIWLMKTAVQILKVKRRRRVRVTRTKFLPKLDFPRPHFRTSPCRKNLSCGSW